MAASPEDFQGEPAAAPCPPTTLPSWGPTLRSGPRCFPRHWSPRIDLGFGRLASDFQGESAAAPCPPTTLPSRGTALRSGPRCFPRHWSPRIDLGFGRPSAPATGTPETPGGVEPRPPGWASSSADKNLDRGMTFNGSQRVSCSATHDTLTQNQVVYESFSTGFSTNFRCVSREGRRSFVRSPVQSRMALRTGRPRGVDRLSQANQSPAALRYRHV